MTIDYRLGPEQVFSGLLNVQYSLTFSPLDPSQRQVFRPRPHTTPFAATGYVVPKRTLLYESIIVHTHYSLKSVNILHVISRLGSKISIIFYH